MFDGHRRKLQIALPFLVGLLVVVGALWPLAWSAMSPNGGDSGAVVFTNERSINAIGTVYVVHGPVTAVNVTYGNGTEKRYAVGEDLPFTVAHGFRDVRSIEPADGRVLYTDAAAVPPGESRTLVEMTPHLPHVTVISTMHREDGRVEWAVKHDCGVDLVKGVRIELEADGVRTWRGCAGWDEALPALEAPDSGLISGEVSANLSRR